MQQATGGLGHAPGRRDTIRHFLSFAETILDKMLAVGGRYRLDRIRFVGRDAIDSMVKARQGALLVTAHMGCLEMCQASAESTPGMKLTVLVHTVHAQQFNRMLERLSPGRGISLLQVTEISPATAVMLAERVERGEFVAIAGDRVPIVAGRASAVQVPFLGTTPRSRPVPTCWRRSSSARSTRWAASARTTPTRWCSSGSPTAWCCHAAIASAPAPSTPPPSRSASNASWRVRRSSGSTSFPSGINPGRSALPQRPRAMTDSRSISFDGSRLTIEDVCSLAARDTSAELSADPAFRARIRRGADFLERLLREDGVVYGVTTGYGDSCTVVIPPELVAELPHHLFAYHGVGLGRMLDPAETRAVLAARLQSLAQGVSGVSVDLLEQLTAFLQHDVLPRIPAEGSVGASGDLTPLSYVAAALCGERDVAVPGPHPAGGRGARHAGPPAAAPAPEGRPGDHERHRRDDRAGLPGP